MSWESREASSRAAKGSGQYRAVGGMWQGSGEGGGRAEHQGPLAVPAWGVLWMRVKACGSRWESWV